MTGRRAATFRLAWRLVRKSRARSLLIALLVAIPVMAGAFAAVTIRTANLSPAEAADRQLGRADAIVAETGSNRPLSGDFDLGRSSNGQTLTNVPVRHGHESRAAWTSQLPSGSRITPAAWTRYARLRVGNRAQDVEAVALDLHDPQTTGIYRIRVGRAPVNSGETAVTTALAKAFRLHIGDVVDYDGRQLRVAAIVENPTTLGEQSLVAPIDALGGVSLHRHDRTAPVAGNWAGYSGYWLVDTPGAAPDLHAQLLRSGVVYETRAQWEHPAPELISTRQVDAQVLIVLGTVAGFGLLEVLLLAGAAFAVGTRRQTRELGLLAATGGDDTDIRRTVLAQGALLGIGGAVIGLGAGVLAVELLRGVLERVADKRFGALDVAATDLIAVAVLGIIAGLLAAIVPARAAAARSVLDMLRERYDADSRRARLPRWSIIAIVGGVALTMLSAWRWHQGSGDVSTTFVDTGSASAVVRGLVALFRHNAWPGAMWFGAVLTLAGLVRACPAIVSRLAGLSGSLPLSPRLAMRDAGRHRHRTAPAIAAVMTVVAGAVLVLFVASSSDLRDRNEFQAAVPIGLVSVQTNTRQQSLADTATRTAALIGGGTQVVINDAGLPNRPLVAQNPHCANSASEDLAQCQFHTIGVATPDAIDLIVGRTVPAAHRALASGEAVLLDPSLASDSTVGIRAVGPRPQSTRLRAVVVPGLPSYGVLPQVYVSAQTAADHGWQTHGNGGVALVKPTHQPSADVMNRAQAALGEPVYIFLQTPYHSRYSVVLLAMLGAAAIATLAGTSIAVALAMAESRADMATMAAVGASPVRRRVHAMGQAGIVAGLGTGLGVALGALVAVATLAGSERYPTSTPFAWLAGVLVVAPLLAIAVAGLVTRSRVTLTRRIA